MRSKQNKTRNVPRAFVRDGALTIRMPENFKRKLVLQAGSIGRDTSNLGLEFLQQGYERLEAWLRANGHGGLPPFPGQYMEHK